MKDKFDINEENRRLHNLAEEEIGSYSYYNINYPGMIGWEEYMAIKGKKVCEIASIDFLYAMKEYMALNKGEWNEHYIENVNLELQNRIDQILLGDGCER